jgi:hypothetical protein
MSQVLQVNQSLLEKLHQNTLSQDQIFPLLTQYQMLPQLFRESLIDQAISEWECSANRTFSCTEDETEMACRAFYDRHQLTSEAKVQTWLARHGMTHTQLEAIALRQLKIEQFKQATWGHQVEPYFLKRKAQLDQVIYSLFRTQDLGIAQEFYFRIREGEQSFADLAAQSQGPESQTGGLCGPVDLGALPTLMTGFLAIAEPGQLSAPIRFGEWFILMRLEKRIPAQLNETMRQRLLNELFESWIEERCSLALAVHHQLSSS